LGLRVEVQPSLALAEGVLVKVSITRALVDTISSDCIDLSGTVLCACAVGGDEVSVVRAHAHLIS
jgi:hypothetical protein